MDPFEDIFRSAATSADNSSTIDDDFDALFGNISVPTSSDLDSILCEDDSLGGQDEDFPTENKTASALGDESSETPVRVDQKTVDRNESVTSISNDFSVGSSGLASVDLEGSETSPVPSKDTVVRPMKVDEYEKTQTPSVPNSTVSNAGAQKSSNDVLCDLDRERKPNIPGKEMPASNDLSDIFAVPPKDTDIFPSPSDGITDLFVKPPKHTDICATKSKEETNLFATPLKKKPDTCASPAKEESDIFATPSEKETDIFATQPKGETDIFSTPSKKETDIFATLSNDDIDMFSTPSKKKSDIFTAQSKNETDLFAVPSKEKTDIFAAQSNDETDVFATPSKKRTDIFETQSKIETDSFSSTVSKEKKDSHALPSKKPVDVSAPQTEEMDIFSTPPEKKTDIFSTDSEGEPDIFSTTSEKKTLATEASIFDEEFLSSPSSMEEVRDATQPLDALSEAADVKSREATLPLTLTADDEKGGDIQDFFENLDSLPEVSDMEKLETEPMLMEKEMDSSWILITDPSGGGELTSEAKKTEKEVEKEDETEKDKDEKEKAETSDREQSDSKGSSTREDFMDFSILELPGYAHLNLDVNKHKRTLSKKGSISRRKRPTRAAIHSGGTDSEEMHFQDSTEPKPKVPDMSSDKSKAQKDEHFGDRDESEENIRAPEPSHAKPLMGGIKIPGLLEGLSKAKPFAKKTKESSEEAPKKMSTDSEKKDTSATAVDSKKPVPVPRPSTKSAVPPPTSLKPSALSRVLPIPPASKVLKDSQNKNIVEAQASVKPSSLTGSSLTGQAKLPPMKTETSSSPKLVEATKTPPPVARKPTVPSKPKTPPKSTSSMTSSPVKLNTSLTSAKDKVTNAPATSLKNETSPPAKPAVKVPPKPRLKPISSGSKDGTSKMASPSVVEKSNITLSPVTHPLPGIDKSSEKSELNEKSSDKKENIPLSPTKDISKSKSILSSEKEGKNDTDSDSKTPVIDADKNEGSKIELAPRKTSISGISPVSPPMAWEKSAPRKNSITGSAYAPIGFRSTIGSMTDGEGKSRTSSVSSIEESKPPLSRQFSEGQSTGIISSPTKSTINVRNDQSGEPALRSKPTDLTNGKSTKLNSDSVLKEANGSIVGDTAVEKTPAKSTDANGEKGGTPWGVQLRKTEKKVPPPKPTASKETENPVNWRQSLGQRRRSSTPKEIVEKPSEPEKPDWMKELSERRKRLINSGFIAGDAK